jgi:hypothetical protein
MSRKERFRNYGGFISSSPPTLTVSGWVSGVPFTTHFCFPPRVYPTGFGPSSTWNCSCGQTWVSEGLRVHPDYGYPVAASRNDTAVGPVRWKPIGQGSTLAQPGEIALQAECLYDFRALGDVLLPLLRERLGR